MEQDYYIRSAEFDRFAKNVDDRFGRIEGKVDQLLARDSVQASIDSKAVAKKAAMHVGWITPLVLAIIEAFKLAFGGGK